MKPYNLFDFIWKINYRKTGFDLDWQIRVSPGERKIRLFFQPSSSIKDWIVNIAGFLPTVRFIKGIPFCFAMGWLKVFEACEDLILNELMGKINENPEYTVEICGHSYGGAISVIAALKLYKRTSIKADIVTFGAPQPLFLITSKLFASLFTGKVIQYRHKSDIVPYMPPFFGYHNINNEWLGKFSFRNLFNPNIYHMIYDQKELYREGNGQ